MPEPLPLADLLAVLKERGLPIGVREHLTVGRLLSRWDDTDTGSLRSALSAVLARNPDEARVVREAFDELYGAHGEEVEEGSDGTGEGLPVTPPPRTSWLPAAAWLAAALALVLLAGAWLWPEPPGPEPQSIPRDPGTSVPEDAPAPPKIPDTLPRPDWQRSLAAAAGVSAGLFLWLYGVRFRRQARRRARGLWSEQADALPGPYGYEPETEGLAPAFPAAVLDDMAGILGRRASVPPSRGDIDVDRTLARTLRAGLAPHIVLRSRASSHPILVLEDVGGEMRPWRRPVSALLSGLEARGVPLDRWQFHADAGRVFRPGYPGLTLKQLYRLRAESPLLVISVGEGILEGGEGRMAAWVDTLRGWRHSAWLHPVTDAGYWSPALRRVPIHVWPMTPEGLLAAARQAARGELGRPARESARAFPDRPVVPLDVDRLRWLLALAPHRTPELGELLRQRFCPDVPPAALLEALEAPPPLAPPGVGPSPEEVHLFLGDLLAASEPPSGTAAHERWRLDRALQQLRIPDRGNEAAQELIEMSRGPLASEVERAVEELVARRPGPDPPIPPHGARYLKRKILGPLRRRAGREGAAGRGEGLGWRWPQVGEALATLLCAAVLLPALPQLGGPFQRDANVRLELSYDLQIQEPVDSQDSRRSLLRVRPYKNVDVLKVVPTLYQDGNALDAVSATAVTRNGIPVEPGHWYDLRTRVSDELLAVSNQLWVPPIERPPSPPIPEMPLEPKPQSGGDEESTSRTPSTPEPQEETAPSEDPDIQERRKDIATLVQRLDYISGGIAREISAADPETTITWKNLQNSVAELRIQLQSMQTLPEPSAIQSAAERISSLESRVELLRRQSSPAQAQQEVAPIVAPISAEARLNIDWCIQDAGGADCPGQYEEIAPECLYKGNRSCLLAKAIDLAKQGDCDNAVRLTLICQCHNPNARKSIEDAGREAVCNYLESK